MACATAATECAEYHVAQTLPMPFPDGYVLALVAGAVVVTNKEGTTVLVKHPLRGDVVIPELVVSGDTIVSCSDDSIVCFHTEASCRITVFHVHKLQVLFDGYVLVDEKTLVPTRVVRYADRKTLSVHASEVVVSGTQLVADEYVLYIGCCDYLIRVFFHEHYTAALIARVFVVGLALYKRVLWVCTDTRVYHTGVATATLVEFATPFYKTFKVIATPIENLEAQMRGMLVNDHSGKQNIGSTDNETTMKDIIQALHVNKHMLVLHCGSVVFVFSFSKRRWHIIADPEPAVCVLYNLVLVVAYLRKGPDNVKKMYTITYNGITEKETTNDITALVPAIQEMSVFTAPLINVSTTSRVCIDPLQADESKRTIVGNVLQIALADQTVYTLTPLGFGEKNDTGL